MSMIDVHRKQAEYALEQRSKLVSEVRSINTGNLTVAEKRERIEALNVEIEFLTAQARDAVEQAEREAEVRTLTANAGPLFMPSSMRQKVAEGEWRSLLPSIGEYRTIIAEGTPNAGGYSVPTGVRKQAIDMLRQRSVFMSAPGLNVIPFESNAFVLPGIGSFSEPGVTAEGATIAEGSQTFTGAAFAAVKYADLRWATAEILSDSALPLREVIANEMVRAIGNKVDKDAFGAGNGATALKGLTAAAQSTNTALPAGKTQVTWDNVIDAYAAAVAAGSIPTVIWVSADQYGGLLKERETTTGGAYLAGSVSADPATAALGLPLLVSGNLPARTVIVADATRIFVGVRQDVQVKVSEDAGFEADRVGFRATYRVGGLVVAESTSVQRITAATA